MSDTPETDLAIKAGGGDWSPVLRVTSQRLERQRNEWAAMCGRYKQERDEINEKYRWAVIHWQIGAAKMERERDEAREKLEKEMKWHHQTHKELVETQCKLLDMEYDKLKG